MAPTRKLISVVLPVHDEAAGLPELYRELARLIDRSPHDFELIFVNDGSGDGSLDLIRELAARDPRVIGIDLSRNYGHQAALTAGTHAARGDAVIHMDADLQDPPALIPTFVDKWLAGAEIVETQRVGERKPATKRLLSAWFYRVFNQLSDTRIVAGGSDFRLLDRRCVDALNALPERDRFLRGLTRWIGFRRELVTYEPGRRAAGASSYTLKKSWRLALDGLVHFSSVPLTLALYVGGVIVAGSLLYLAVTLVSSLGSDAPAGTLWALATILLVGGLNLVATGVLSVYVWKIFDQIRGRPIYIVRERIGVDEEAVVTGRGLREPPPASRTVVEREPD